MLTELEQEYVGRRLDVTFAINEKFTKRIDALRARAVADMKSTAEPAYRLLQVLAHLR